MAEREHRERTLTEKGRLYELSRIEESRDSVKRKISMKLDDMSDHVQHSRHVMLRQDVALLDMYMKEYLLLHAKCQLLMDTEDRSDQDGAVDNFEKEVMDRKRHFIGWLSQFQVENESNHGSDKSKNAKSVLLSKPNSRKSTTSSQRSRDRLLKEKARLEELKIEAEFLEVQKREEEKASAYLRSQEIAKQKLVFEKEMAKTRAKIRIYENDDDDLGSLNSGVIKKETLPELPVDRT